jgi:hypothetical protein
MRGRDGLAMNIITHETERIHQLQRQLQEAEQFRALAEDMRLTQRRYRTLKRYGWPVNGLADTLERRCRLEAAVDRELRLLDSE